ncbi:unnamed protein product [Ixodes persulcatus]
MTREPPAHVCAGPALQGPEESAVSVPIEGAYYVHHLLCMTARAEEMLALLDSKEHLQSTILWCPKANHSLTTRTRLPKTETSTGMWTWQNMQQFVLPLMLLRTQKRLLRVPTVQLSLHLET